MAESIKPELLQFLTASGVPLKILVVESLCYLKDLRQMFPHAEIYAVVAEEDKAEEWTELEVTWRFLDYREVPLPFPKKYFDYIISDLTLEQVINPQDTAAGFGLFLKETGALLTSFRNIRHWTVLQKLMEGHYYGLVSRLYARAEFENLLYASFYKEVRVRPQYRYGDAALIKRLTDAGFENLHDDLNTEFFLVWAARSMPELSLLKSMFTTETRKQLSRLLHRIEYGVEPEKSCLAFWKLYEETGIFADYAAAFIKEAVFHPEQFYENLGAYTPKSNAEDVQAILAAVAADRYE
ncbi:MAG: hypothetical protein IJ849_10070 [Selenomonadaceae bacterium]|nr:hypothetical protein [Selenomonadaceae bacterium]